MGTREIIDSFFKSEKIAIAGVSRNENKFGSMLYKELDKKGYNLVGVNSHLNEIQGKACFKSISDLPDDTDALLIVVKPEKTLSLIQEAEKKGIKRFWIQQGAQSRETLKYCKEKNLEFTAGECALMYCDPVESIHRFHRSIKKIFGTYHKS